MEKGQTMNCSQRFGLSPRTITRLSAGLLVAAALAAGSLAAHPQRAAADGPIPAPSIESFSIVGQTANVTMRDNGPGGDSYDFQVEFYQGTDPQHHDPHEQIVYRSDSLGAGVSKTLTINNDVTPGQSYCIQAAAWWINVAQPLQASPESNMICASPTSGVVLNPGRISTEPCLACKVGTQSSTPAPTLPDFAVTRISGDQQVTQGFTKTYDVVVANLGARPQTQVQVQIQVTGSLNYQQMVQTPAGFTCTGNGPITCVGPLGGYGDAPITTVADFQLQVYAGGTGLGSISASADPNNLITESNETNNAQSLAVTVK
jgi:hypothetical protein